MIIIGATLLSFGGIGAVVCFATAWAMRDDKKWLKRLIVAGIICIIATLIGIGITSSLTPSGGSSSSKEKCLNCGRQSVYDLGYCKTCYEGFMDYTYGD